MRVSALGYLVADARAAQGLAARRAFGEFGGVSDRASVLLFAEWRWGCRLRAFLLGRPMEAS
eukprot:5068791-Lingulodinium_polyedra.AAC.1